MRSKPGVGGREGDRDDEGIIKNGSEGGRERPRNSGREELMEGMEYGRDLRLYIQATY